jgi:predicted ATPase
MRDSVMRDQVVGRDAELQATSAFLRAMAGGPAGLVFAGEPGIGKTTLWRHVIGQARRGRSIGVVLARPVAADARYGYAVLEDLFGWSMSTGLLGRLPWPQRHALGAALLRDSVGEGIDPRAVGAAVVSVLTEMSRSGPVLVAVDDAQWLDRPSARVLAFAARRLGRAPVGFLTCEETGTDRQIELDLGRELQENPVKKCTLGPLTAAELRQIAESRTGRPPSRPALAQIGQAAGGNPFYAVEVARLLPDRPPPGQAMAPVPESLSEVVAARLALLPDLARRVLLPVAVLRYPTVDLVAAGIGAPYIASELALEQAAAAGIAERTVYAFHFTHPLYASVVYSSTPPPERRLVHRRLAAALHDMEEQACHLALAAEGPDAELAGALAAAASHAGARGAPDTAFDLTEQALELTPPDQIVDVERRRIQAAEYRRHASEP